MIRVIGATPRNPTSALIPVAREDLAKLDKRTTLYVLSDVAVVLAPCWCGADYNELCIGKLKTYAGRTHADRRIAAKKTETTLGLDEQLHVAYLLQQRTRGEHHGPATARSVVEGRPRNPHAVHRHPEGEADGGGHRDHQEHQGGALGQDGDSPRRRRARRRRR